MSACEITGVLGNSQREGAGGTVGSKARQKKRPNGVDFVAVNQAALAALPSLLGRWLPDGRIEGAEFVATNPKRADRHHGFFRINMNTGRWADFAIGGARGGDIVSLTAYIAGIGQVEAAKRLGEMLGIEARYGR